MWIRYEHRFDDDLKRRNFPFEWVMDAENSQMNLISALTATSSPTRPQPFSLDIRDEMGRVVGRAVGCVMGELVSFQEII